MNATPLHLSGNHAPVSEEVTLREQDLAVVGAIPGDLDGLFLRNGPNPRTGWSAHMFDGDGMVHGLAISDGRARWYRNRYIRTPMWANPGASRVELSVDRRTGEIDPRVTTANTHVIEHDGRLLALEEGGHPYEIDDELNTVGAYNFAGALTTPMTAHPKTCPGTGDLLFFGYQVRPPHLTLYRAAPGTGIEWVTTVDLPVATMMHDFAMTATRVVVFDSPLQFDATAIAQSGSPWVWNERHGARLGVLPRGEDGAHTRWFEVDPRHVSHAANAYDDGDAVVITGTQITAGGLPRMHEWRLDLTTRTVSERSLDDASSEYPRVASDLVGLANRYVYSSSFSMASEPDHSEIYKYDLLRDERSTSRLPHGTTCGEPVFVRRDLSAEDAGYLLTFAHDRARAASSLLILDASQPGVPPLAQIQLPVRVPGGFHGSWVPSR